MTEQKPVCKFCKKEFKNEENLVKHVCLHCKGCDYTFSRAKYLKTHKCKDLRSDSCKIENVNNIQLSFQNQTTESLDYETANLHPSLPDKTPGNSKVISGVIDSDCPVLETMESQATAPCQFDEESHEITVVRVERHSTSFKPVDCMWQFEKCDLPNLKLPLRCSVKDTEFKESAGAPKEVKKILGDGNCLQPVFK